jgi:hypothetical protein
MDINKSNLENAKIFTLICCKKSIIFFIENTKIYTCHKLTRKPIFTRAKSTNFGLKSTFIAYLNKNLKPIKKKRPFTNPHQV